MNGISGPFHNGSKSTSSPITVEDARVVLLNNYITPHHRKIYDALAKRVGQLTILLSTPMESNRNWKPDWGDLDVQVQKNWTITRQLKHKHGFQDANYIHIPYDTLSQLKRLKPDVLVSYEMGFRTLCSSWARWRQQIPMLMVVNISMHTERNVVRSRQMVRHFLKRRADAITFNGPSCRQYLSQELGIGDDLLYHVPYASDPDKHYLGSVNRPVEHQYDLLFTGQLASRKGIMPFTEALANWASDNPHRSLRFRIAGDGPQRQELEQLEVPDNLSLELLGHCDPSRLVGLYAEAGIYVFPTLADEWGMVSEEAWMAGLPILGSQFAQSFETFNREGETGWMYQPTNPRQIYEAIDRAMNTAPEKLEAMREPCREMVQHRTPEHAADRFVEAISAAMRRHHSAGHSNRSGGKA